MHAATRIPGNITSSSSLGLLAVAPPLLLLMEGFKGELGDGAERRGRPAPASLRGRRPSARSVRLPIDVWSLPSSCCAKSARRSASDAGPFAGTHSPGSRYSSSQLRRTVLRNVKKASSLPNACKQRACHSHAECPATGPHPSQPPSGSGLAASCSQLHVRSDGWQQPVEPAASGSACGSSPRSPAGSAGAEGSPRAARAVDQLRVPHSSPSPSRVAATPAVLRRVVVSEDAMLSARITRHRAGRELAAAGSEPAQLLPKCSSSDTGKARGALLAEMPSACPA